MLPTVALSLLLRLPRPCLRPQQLHSPLPQRLLPARFPLQLRQLLHLVRLQPLLVLGRPHQHQHLHLRPHLRLRLRLLPRYPTQTTTRQPQPL